MNAVKMMVEANPAMLDEIAGIVEPYVLDDLKKFRMAHDKVIFESAILGKSKRLIDLMDRIVLVDAPLKTRIERIKKRDPNRSDSEIKMLVEHQKKSHIKLCDLDWVVKNDGRNLDAVIEHIIKE